MFARTCRHSLWSCSVTPSAAIVSIFIVVVGVSAAQMGPTIGSQQPSELAATYQILVNDAKAYNDTIHSMNSLRMNGQHCFLDGSDDTTLWDNVEKFVRIPGALDYLFDHLLDQRLSDSEVLVDAQFLIFAGEVRETAHEIIPGGRRAKELLAAAENGRFTAAEHKFPDAPIRQKIEDAAQRVIATAKATDDAKRQIEPTTEGLYAGLVKEAEWCNSDFPDLNSWSMNCEHLFLYGGSPDDPLADRVIDFDRRPGAIDFLFDRLLDKHATDSEILIDAELLVYYGDYTKPRLIDGDLNVNYDEIVSGGKRAKELSEAATNGRFASAEKHYANAPIREKIMNAVTRALNGGTINPNPTSRPAN